jgi:hypothetical protein
MDRRRSRDALPRLRRPAEQGDRIHRRPVSGYALLRHLAQLRTCEQGIANVPAGPRK